MVTHLILNLRSGFLFHGWYFAGTNLYQPIPSSQDVFYQPFTLVLQGNVLKMGDLEARLSDSLNRNQIKYLTVKLFKDEVLNKEGNKSGTFYAISKQFSHLRGDSLIHAVIDHLRKKHEPLDSPND
jgi:hypothetical protein